MEPYFCLYVGTNIIELLRDEKTAVTAGFCDVVNKGDLKMRQQLFDKIYEGEDCESTVKNLNYQASKAAIYDPLSQEMDSGSICDKFTEMIDLLKSVGNDSAVDGLRFSYEVSQVEDNDSQQFSSYASCIELDARSEPYDTCYEIVNRVPNQFALFSAQMKEEVCEGIANDVKSEESDGAGDVCGFITVSAFQVYNEFYRGLSEQLGEWMYEKMQKDLEKME